jgi:hypothetical protein
MAVRQSTSDWLSSPAYSDTAGYDSPTYMPEPPSKIDELIAAAYGSGEGSSGTNAYSTNGGSAATSSNINVGSGNPMQGKPQRVNIPPFSGTITVGADARNKPTLLYLAAAVAVAFFFFNRKKSGRGRRR